jgi:hypothetical protein
MARGSRVDLNCLLPAFAMLDLRAHKEPYARKGEHGHVFVGPKGAKLRRENFTRVWPHIPQALQTDRARNGHGRLKTALETIKARSGIHP